MLKGQHYLDLSLSTMSILLTTLLVQNILRAQITAASTSGSHYLSVYPNVSELASNESVSLYFGLMLSLSGDDESSGALAGIQAALDEINSRDDLLPGYTLHYTLTDSEVRLIIENYHSFILLYTVQSYSCSLWTFYSAF